MSIITKLQINQRAVPLSNQLDQTVEKKTIGPLFGFFRCSVLVSLLLVLAYCLIEAHDLIERLGNMKQLPTHQRMFGRTHAHTCAHARMCARAHTHTHTHTRTHTHTHAHTHTCTHARAHTHAHTHELDTHTRTGKFCITGNVNILHFLATFLENTRRKSGFGPHTAAAKESKNLEQSRACYCKNRNPGER